jgi:hypothetical protein
MEVGNNKSASTKNAGKSLVISIAMWMWRYNVGCIAQWSMSRDSLGALHRIAPTDAMVNQFVETMQNTNKTQLLASNYGTFC